MAEITPSDVALYGGWTCLGGEFVQTFGTAKALCPTIPAGTKWAEMTVRGATMVLTFNGATPTATVGNDYGVRTERYHLNLDETELAKIKGFSANSGGNATVYITYFGVK